MARSKVAQAAIDDALSINAPSSEVGLGIDLVDIERMRKVLARTPSFAIRCFSETECKHVSASSDPAKGYAARFAAKEAAVKALGTGFSEGIGVRDIEVVNDAKGKPRLILHGRAQEIAQCSEIIEMVLSMSHSDTYAVACVIAMRSGSKPAEKKKDPAHELASRFKELRLELDDLVVDKKNSSQKPENE